MLHDRTPVAFVEQNIMVNHLAIRPLHLKAIAYGTNLDKCAHNHTPENQCMGFATTVSELSPSSSDESLDVLFNALRDERRRYIL